MEPCPTTLKNLGLQCGSRARRVERRLVDFMCMANPRSVRESKRKPHNSNVATRDGCGVRGIWNTAIRVLADIPGSEAERERARELASLPLRMGLGLRSMTPRSILDLVG